MFSGVSDLLERANTLNPEKKQDLTEQWKMAFHPDPTKLAQEVVFFFNKTSFIPNLYFEKFVVEKMQTQKHYGLKIDKKLSCKDHVKDKFAKINRGI